MTNHGSRNAEAANNGDHVTVQRTHMNWGNAVGPLIGQIGPSTADEVINHMKYYLDQKLNPLLVHPLTGTDGS